MIDEIIEKYSLQKYLSKRYVEVSLGVLALFWLFYNAYSLREICLIIGVIWLAIIIGDFILNAFFRSRKDAVSSCSLEKLFTKTNADYLLAVLIIGLCSLLNYTLQQSYVAVLVVWIFLLSPIKDLGLAKGYLPKQYLEVLLGILVLCWLFYSSYDPKEICILTVVSWLVMTPGVYLLGAFPRIIKKISCEYVPEKLFTKRNLNYLLVGITVVFCSLLNCGLKDSLSIIIVMWIVLNPISSILSAKIALLFLCLIPIAEVMSLGQEAEYFSLAGYFFLIVMIIETLIERKNSLAYIKKNSGVCIS